MEHSFTFTIRKILATKFGEYSNFIFENSPLIQYINIKTKSANKGSKARSSFANLYAIYVIVEDYIKNGFVTSRKYNKYEGAVFTNLLKRLRELPFGRKSQNHALNNRLNAEFKSFFHTLDWVPIMRDLQTNRYWINENLIIIKQGKKNYNIAQAVIDIIDEYVKTKQDSFQRFISQCKTLQNLKQNQSTEIHDFIFELLAPNVDARLFEIVSYSILKSYYKDTIIIWGYDMKHLNSETLKLYKTGRTNANDGGIDFVMKPLGRFFQVTETLDFKKYFLDIEKIEKYPITFVIKSEECVNVLKSKLQQNALKTYVVESIVNRYMECIEELINIPTLKLYFSSIEKKALLFEVLDEIILQSRIEFNCEEDENS